MNMSLWKILKPSIKVLLSTSAGRKALGAGGKEALRQLIVNLKNRGKGKEEKKESKSLWARLFGEKDNQVLENLKASLGNIEIHLKRLFIFQIVSIAIAITALILALVK